MFAHNEDEENQKQLKWQSTRTEHPYTYRQSVINLTECSKSAGATPSDHKNSAASVHYSYIE